MVEGTLPNVMPSGRTPEISVFKKYNYENYHAGQKKDIEYTGNPERWVRSKDITLRICPVSDERFQVVVVNQA